MWMNCNEMNIALRLAFCSHCHRRIVEFSFLLNWIFPQKPFFFVIELFFSYRIFGNILDCLKYWYLTASYCVCEWKNRFLICSVFWFETMSKYVQCTYKFGLCGYFFLFNQSIPSPLFVFLLMFQLNQPIIERLFYNRYILFLILYQCVQF